MQIPTSREIGAISVVAGTAIGAGMLGLPMVIGKLGFIPATVIMLVIWGLAVYSALLLLEVNLRIGAGKNFNDMAHTVLGRGGQIVATGSMIFLQFALLVAYLTGFGELIAQTMTTQGLELSAQSGALYFAVAAYVIVFIGTQMIVRVNQLLFFAMIAAMVTALFSLVPGVDVGNLQSGSVEQGIIVASLPVLFTSFGFHASIPSIIKYLDAPVRKLRLVTVVGSALPLVCYLFWIFVSIGGTTPESLHAMSSVDSLVATLAAGSGWLQTILSAFASLALLTSFFGVALAMYDLLAEVCKMRETVLHRAITTMMVFLPPLVAALLCPGRFIQALAHAGAALAILAIFLPCAMAWKLRHQDKAQMRVYQVPGGTPALVLAVLFGLVIVTANYV
jgi:tyrosine-specific transport protein